MPVAMPPAPRCARCCVNWWPPRIRRRRCRMASSPRCCRNRASRWRAARWPSIAKRSRSRRPICGAACDRGAAARASMTDGQLFLPCAAGVEALLADEVAALQPGAKLQSARGGVALTGPGELAMRLNLESRLAQRVLWRVADAAYRSEHDLYALAHTVRWHDWITPKQTLRVDTTARNAPLKSLNFASLRVKDAVCDAMREHAGARPDVDTRDPDLSLVLHLDGNQASLYVDTSGVPLFKRGWR